MSYTQMFFRFTINQLVKTDPQTEPFLLRVFSQVTLMVFEEKKTLWRCGLDIDLEKAGGIIRCLYTHCLRALGFISCIPQGK
ncbi:hypothetical protein DBR06_SOUSAS9410077, partial [Sousa chinensis]